MAKFNKNQSIREFQRFIGEVYGLPDDRLYSIWDLITHNQRFAMRALKGIRKGEARKIKINLLIALSWLMAIANRLHIDVEEGVWKRFPMLCSYCAHLPCVCKKKKPSSRQKVKINNMLRPKTLADFQEMFAKIYPSTKRTLSDAGVHLAEEVGEIGEAVHVYLGQHKHSQFNDVKSEIADLVSCIIGVANSAQIDLASELASIFKNDCHICRKSPCICSFTKVAQLKS
jgi:NTP pyrophosphatase (non-canonical NTP hydrolase)